MVSKAAEKKLLAYKTIKEKILNGELKPLGDISEEALMKEFGISRTPIRESIQRLEKEGFVYIYPRKGTIVADITLDLIHQIYETRFLVEPYMSKSICGRLDREWLEDIKKRFLVDLTQMDKKEQVKYYINLDRELHEAILDKVENRFVKQLMINITDHNQRIRIKTAEDNTFYIDEIAGHVEIIDAYLAEDPERIEKALIAHLEASKRYTLKYFIK